ncbi:MAG: hypothetical protein JNM36_14205 [Chitinophagales bacterium]|jgi:hypothetical protein|nr:hypothetical protein [Chitinophagales bacterium]HNI43752.1 hypothetical protein [Chitinophagales bacterium]HNL07691.1 hypothetical protein [Chitinophagales bacterium]
MKQLLILFTVLLLGSHAVFAQKGGSGADAKPEFIPGAIYEVRYWTDMSGRDPGVKIDTMIFFNDRSSFEYSNDRCLSCPYISSDSIIYSLLPTFNSSSEKEFTLGNNYVRRANKAIVPFRKYDRMIYRVYVSELKDKYTAMGNYALVSSQFGVIYRYSNRGDFWMLNRIDIYKDGKAVDEIDLLPLQAALSQSKIFIEDEK